MARWSIEMNNLSLGGFAPAWYKETYPTYGNKNHAGAMVDMDLTNPGYIQQGPGLATLTAGDENGAVTTLIKGILETPTSSDVTYAIGGAKLYQLSSSAVTNAGSFPHTIDKAVVTGEDGEDVAVYQGNLYYSYNHSGSAGDIGKFDLTSTFDDDWGSTTPTGAAALQNAPHPMVVGGNDVLYFGNGRYIGEYDGTTFNDQALDFPPNTKVVALQWLNDRLWATVNYINLTGSNKNRASIFIWNGTTDSWEVEIPLPGKGGASYTKNGVLFQFYQDISSTGGYKLSYISGNNVVDVANYTGALPSFYQVSEYKDFLIWDSSGSIYAWGSGDRELPVRLFQFADSGYTTAGGLATPFGTPIIASNQTTSYKLAKFSGLATTSNWKSILFDVTGNGRRTRLDFVRINFEQLQSSSRVDWKLLDNTGKTIYNDTISHTKLGAVTTFYYPLNGKQVENFRVEFDYTNGDTTNSVKIKNVKIYGSTD